MGNWLLMADLPLGEIAKIAIIAGIAKIENPLGRE
jgi:hypothetical protein